MIYIYTYTYSVYILYYIYIYILYIYDDEFGKPNAINHPQVITMFIGCIHHPQVVGLWHWVYRIRQVGNLAMMG